MNILASVRGGFSKYLIVFLFMFIAGCFLGYVFELLYRRFFSAKKWVNPGFLKGPWLPLYGFGLVTMFLISALIADNLPSWPLYNPTGNLFANKTASGPSVYDLIPIAIIFVCLIALEFLAGLIFVKGFKVRLWDYTNLKGNILGIICPQFSLIWLAVDLLYYYAVNPYLYQAFTGMFDFIFGTEGGAEAVNVILIFLIGVVYGLFLLDLVASLNLFGKLKKLMNESEGYKNYERFREQSKGKLLLAKAELANKIPEKIKQAYEQGRKKKQQQTSRFNEWIRKMIFIDPNKSQNQDNYGQDGRPKKEE